ncbi:MAG: response regulator [Bacteroidales bacterium]|jgi:CheY-like chemotaxis protein|nr:response regulator [Bacteroidales bacterium]
MSQTRIVIFEDELLLANDLKRQIMSLGYDVSAMFGKAEEGLAYLEKIENKEEFPEVILMDVSLAGTMTGIEAAEIITYRYHCGVVFLSGVNQPEVYERCFKDHPRAFLLKPFDISQAIFTIRLAKYLNDLEIQLQQYQLKSQ